MIYDCKDTIRSMCSLDIGMAILGIWIDDDVWSVAALSCENGVDGI